MKSERWKQIDHLLDSALELKPEERPAFLAERCQGDEALRREVESLLAHEQAKDFMDSPALEVAAQAIAADQIEERRTHVMDGPPDDTTRKFATNQLQTNVNPSALMPGVMLAERYLIEKELGQGGIGVVYLARDQKLHHAPVVIKVLLEKVRENKHQDWIEKKFRQEIMALSRIDHPGVVRALDVGELPDGRTYLVMQHVSGVSLRSVISSRGMGLARVGHLIRQIGQALTAAHEQGIFHRDLKPENIMLQQAGGEEYPKLIDFGIATVLETPNPATIQATQVAGTLDYMAPEQLQGKPTAASDIYALGVIAYEMLTGRMPFNPETGYGLLEMQRTGVRIKPCDLRPGLPIAAQTVILKALSFAQADRHARAKDFGDALAQALSVEVKETQPTLSGLELAHVLFTDLVGYSKLTIDEQTLLLQYLQEVVSATESFQRAQASNQLLRLPTGDGMALVFFGDPLLPVKCAVDVARALRSRPEIKLRMGVHTGPVQRLSDINQNVNVSGGGINMAQRVMDCGEAGHILLSRNVADVLSQLKEWSQYLQDWGEQEVKHGVKVHIFNLHTGEAGNPELPAKLRRVAPPEPRKKRPPLVIMAALLAVMALGAITWWAIQSRFGRTPSLPETASAIAPARQLSYWLTVQKDPKRYPSSKPFILGSEIIFEAGYQVQLHISSPQAGYLYIINEGPVQTNGLPDYNVLFPDTATNNGSAEMTANQQIQVPQPSGNWIIFDKEEGVEKIWLIWSERSVPELEAVKGRANPQDLGVINDSSQIKSVAQYLATQSAAKPEVEKDEMNKRTKLTAKNSVLIGVVKLEHH